MESSDSRRGSPFVLRFFGSPRIEGPDGVLGGEASQRHRLALLALLTAAPEGLLARDRIQGMVWPETDQAHARRLLNNAVHTIRKALGEDVLLSEGDGLRLNPSAVRVDVFEFEAALEAGDADKAVTRYTGPFLDGLALPDAVEFDQWADRERDRLERLYHNALERLAEAAATSGQRAKAVEWWRLRLACTPTEGRVVLRLMHALTEAGDRADAMRAAATHAALLEQEFGAAPDPQVESLAEQLRRAPAKHEVAAAIDAPHAERAAASAASALESFAVPPELDLEIQRKKPLHTRDWLCGSEGSLPQHWADLFSLRSRFHGRMLRLDRG